jgi:hypothetical protein
MENTKYKITGTKKMLLVTKDYDDDFIEINVKFTFGSWCNESGTVEINSEIVSASYNTINTFHPIILPEIMKLDLDEQLFDHINDDLELFDYDPIDAENYIEYNFANDINHNIND